jgi:hypothetical protein
MRKVDFDVVYCTSFDDEYEPHQLLPIYHTPHARGWQTARCVYLVIQRLPSGVCRPRKRTRRGHAQKGSAVFTQPHRFCDFPQELILKLGGLYRIRQVQILSHQFKISSRIELYCGSTPVGSSLPDGGAGDQHGFLDCEFIRLGYVSLESIQRQMHGIT